MSYWASCKQITWHILASNKVHYIIINLHSKNIYARMPRKEHSDVFFDICNIQHIFSCGSVKKWRIFASCKNQIYQLLKSEAKYVHSFIFFWGVRLWASPCGWRRTIFCLGLWCWHRGDRLSRRCKGNGRVIGQTLWHLSTDTEHCASEYPVAVVRMVSWYRW